MRFIDEAKIRVAGGNGGPGCVSFRREVFVPRGGPDGGEGGKGGDVIFIASTQRSTLQDFRFKRVYQAHHGAHGSGSNKAGRDGEDVEINVPVGTIVRDAESGQVLYDFSTPGERWIVCKGGRGGKGNAHFVTSTFQAPKFAQPGEAGEFKELQLELKLLADAGIIGFPNAGKSTLISRISAARPKIADYAFTTLVPNLGVVSLSEFRSFVVADIPGLIEGAHRGLGLGHRFLKHIERTSVFIHMLDGATILEDATAKNTESETSFEASVRKAVERYQIVRNELGLFSEDLLKKPEIVVLNKADLLASDPDLLAEIKEALKKSIAETRSWPIEKSEPWVISTVSGESLNELIEQVYKHVQITKEREANNGNDPGSTPVLPDSETLR